MPQVVDAHVTEDDAFADAPPGALRDGASFRSEPHDMPAGLGVERPEVLNRISFRSGVRLKRRDRTSAVQHPADRNSLRSATRRKFH